jgi:chromate transporter
MTAPVTSTPAEPDQPAAKVPALRLFTAFFRLGLTSFGGPAMVAYIRELAVRKKQWLSQETFEDGAALCQSIPGATAMQTTAYVGLRAGGPRGALAAFVGFGLPAFILMVALSTAYQAGRDLQPVLAVFRGLHVIVIAIIANAIANFGRSSIKNWRDVLPAGGAAAFLACRGNPILAIVGSAALAAAALPAPGAGPRSRWALLMRTVLPVASLTASQPPWPLVPLIEWINAAPMP